MQTVIFDDDALSNFYPLTLNRSIGDLRCGITKLRQRLESIFSDSEETCVLIDESLVPLYQERHPDWIINSAVRGEKLYLNSRIIITADAVEQIQKLDFGSCLYTGQNIVAIKVKDTSIFPDVAKLKKKL
ncbi:MAG: putative sugar nucleotidyl transferase, partial [Candidatus Cloacimonas acidaminovorans]|nr:putative sugar nucleotidyl transferase [Candidatus Cloacimonas acidaminovorans]MDD5407482.1 putative sugar nucleotidyl transferase [Candidatus Cloacimonas acidaminovorans]